MTDPVAALSCVKWSHDRRGEKCDVKSKIRPRQSMRIYLENIPAKFHPDPIWNDEALGFFWKSRPQQQQEQDE